MKRWTTIAESIIERFKLTCPEYASRILDYSVPVIATLLRADTPYPVSIGYELWFRLSGNGFVIYREQDKATQLLNGDL